MTKEALLNQVRAIKKMCDMVLQESAEQEHKPARRKPLSSEDYCRMRREKLLNKKPRG